MKKIGICNNKGGVGKTTISLCLAGTFAEMDLKVLLVDMDQVIAGMATEYAGIDTVGCFNLYFRLVKAEPPTGFCLYHDWEEKDA